jgi:hypothetical protein
MNDDLFSNDYKPTPHRRDNLFGWTVAILFFLGLALGCWIGSYYIFGHPEKPRSYRILQKLKKVEPPRRFELTAAPPGEFLTAQKLFDRYGTMPALQFQDENAELLRTYIRNYEQTKKLVPYVIGQFRIISARELTEDDVFRSGFVALAQSVDLPQVYVEQLFPAPAESVPALKRMLAEGLEMKLARSLDLSAVIHIVKHEDGRMQFTVVPLLYGSYAMKQGAGTFSLEPPEALNLDAGVPVVKAAPFAKIAASAKPSKVPRTTAPAATASAVTGIVRPPAPVPEELVRVQPAVTQATASPTPAEVVKPTPPPVAATTPRPVPPATPAVVARATPVPVPSATPPPAVAAASPEGVQLQPFLAAMPSPPVTSTGGNWRTYPPGQMPRGRLVETSELGGLAERGVGGERLYLRGSFTVTASGENRAVLRSQGGVTNMLKPGSGTMRVIVEFPQGAQPPVEGAAFARDEARPFQITDVRKGADGQINVYVREVTTP